MITVKERLAAYLGYKGLSQSKFEKICGFSNGYVNSMRKGLSQEKLQSVVANFPDLNRDWLVYGEGAMLKDQPQGGISIGNINNNVNSGNHHNTMVGSEELRSENCTLKVEVAQLKAENSHLKEIITEKDERIAEKERTIGILLNK